MESTGGVEGGLGGKEVIQTLDSCMTFSKTSKQTKKNPVVLFFALRIHMIKMRYTDYSMTANGP